jgi:Uma2 family endonuclease
MEAILEPLLRSTKFLRYVDELIDMRRREAADRARFRESLHEDVRAEFINGEVVTQMTARDQHMTTVRNVGRLLDVFAQTRDAGAVRTEQALTEFTRNDYAPDICFWGKEKSRHFTGQTTVYPVPDLVAEVLSPSTEKYDRGVKFEDYAAHGVAEYWLLEPELRVIEQYFVRDGQYELVGKFTEGSIRSRAIEGFEMPVAAAFDDRINVEALRGLLLPPEK